jgi:dCMP deaminase
VRHQRQSWDAYFMSLAVSASTRATCPRRSVGCIIVADKHVRATGYNGSKPGAPHCCDIGCDMVDGHCVRTIHAEANALDQAAQHGALVRGATAYVTTVPCRACFKLLVQAGVVRIVYGEPYRVNSVVGLAAAELGITLHEATGA